MNYYDVDGNLIGDFPEDTEIEHCFSCGAWFAPGEHEPCEIVSLKGMAVLIRPGAGNAN